MPIYRYSVGASSLEIAVADRRVDNGNLSTYLTLPQIGRVQVATMVFMRPSPGCVDLPMPTSDEPAGTAEASCFVFGVMRTAR